VVLDRPRIAGNVGAVARLVANAGAALHVAGPTVLADNTKTLKRAGLDYWDDARVHFHRDLESCLTLLGVTPWVVEVGGEHAPWDVSLQRGDVVVLGPETASVELEVPSERVLTLPGQPGLRSYNLAQCAAMVVYEAMRQQHRP